MNRSPFAPLAFFLAAASMPLTASGQERIELSSTPDLSVLEVILPLGESWQRQRSGEGTSATWSLGAGVASSDGDSGGVAAASLGFGWRTPGFLAGVRSEVTGFVPAKGEGLDLEQTRGHHRALAIGLLGHRRDDFGVNVALDGFARHSGGQPFRLDAPRYGAAPLVSAGGNLGVTLRAGDDEFAGAVPIDLRLEETRWDRGALASARETSVAMGIGVQPGPRDAVRGTLQLLRGSVTHTSFERRAAFAPTDEAIAGAGAISDGFRKVSLGSSVDKMTFFDRKALGTFDIQVGYSWLESDLGPETVRAGGVDFRAGTNVAFGKPGDSSRLGFAVSRDLNRNASGSRIISEWRTEISSDYDHDHVEIGARGALSWLASKAGGDGAANPLLIRYGTHLEAFYKLPLAFQLGGYVASAFEPQETFDPFVTDRSWNTEAGLMLRWKAPKKQQSREPRTICGYEPPPPPPPRPEQRPIQIKVRAQ